MKRMFFLSLLLSATLLAGCDSGTSTNITLNGRVINAAELGSIIVNIIEDNRTRDSADVNSDGTFELNFNSSTGSVTLEFVTDSFTASRQNFSVTENSTIDLDLNILQNPITINIVSWVVMQDSISIGGDDFISFIQSQAEIILNGDGNTCINTRDNTSIEFIVKSISITNCGEGIRVEGTSEVILRADESINITSSENTIRSLNSGAVTIGQTNTPIDNTILVESSNSNGVDASDDSSVLFDPQNSCTIQGADMAVSDRSGDRVDTDTCTLVNG